MEPWGKEFAGRIEEHTFRSAALAGNVLGDPSERPLWVYLPPGYEDADAPPGPVRRARLPRRGRAVRSVLPPRVRQDGPNPPRRVRRILRGLLEGLPVAPGVRQGVRRMGAERVVHGRVLLSRR